MTNNIGYIYLYKTDNINEHIIRIFLLFSFGIAIVMHCKIIILIFCFTEKKNLRKNYVMS